MANGVTVSQVGIDVSQALDSQKVLDSRWKYFEVIHEELLSTGTIPASGTTVLFEHKVGFVPAFDCYDITLGAYVVGDGSGGLRSDKDKAYFQGQDATNTDHSNHKVLLRIYNVPITEEYTALIENTFPVKSNTVSKFGIKITSNSGGSGGMNHLELSEFTLNTQSKALSIQKTGTAVANSGTGNLIVIVHDIGNPPTFLAAQCDPQLQWTNALNPDFIPVVSSADGKTLTFRGAQAALVGTFAYIIFKELADFAI